jgi:predicted DsbA family dithiol-disulfide isomerase
MHAQLLARQDELSDAVVGEIATKLGIDADALMTEMVSADVQEAVVRDARLARSLGAKVIPTIMVNGRAIPRWKIDERSIIPEIIAHAAGD